LITLVERHSRLLMVLPIPTASSPTVIRTLCQAFANLPATMARTLTWDRGIEMSRHAEFSKTTGIPCSSATPTHPAAGQQREHEWAAASVLPEAN
jgi:IS30 family transposase